MSLMAAPLDYRIRAGASYCLPRRFRPFAVNDSMKTGP